MQRRRQHSPRHGPQRRGRSWSWRLGLCVQLEHGLLRRVYCQHLPLSRHRRCPVPSRPPPPEGEALRPKPIQQLHQRNRSSSILEAQPREIRKLETQKEKKVTRGVSKKRFLKARERLKHKLRKVERKMTRQVKKEARQVKKAKRREKK